ncbi:MAG: hypothetical protein Q8O84_01355 [Nanoarchaeota archaeon]|nr:hypothetical protein [Nanoarchaeota archaeon]
MPAITLSIPPELKKIMDSSKMINWSEVARRAFIEQLKDIIELERMKKIRELSEIDIDDNRDFNSKYKKELMKITKSPHTKSLTLNELNTLLGL